VWKFGSSTLAHDPVGVTVLIDEHPARINNNITKKNRIDYLGRRYDLVSSLNIPMAHGIPNTHLGANTGAIKIRYHNGSSVVLGYIVKATGAIRYVVTTDGTTMYEVTLAQTTAQATSMTAGQATILIYPYPSGTEHVMRLQSHICYTTEGHSYSWSRAPVTAAGQGQLEVV
jgi:hypothetical protein